MKAPAGEALVSADAAQTMRAMDAPAPDEKLQLDYASPEKTWHVGTLTYTRAMLVNVFCWMLWGDLCLNVMESVIPRMVPLQLQKLGASDALIGILTGSISPR